MEACGSSHHWGRWFAARGHTMRLIVAEFVKPFRLGGKQRHPLHPSSPPATAMTRFSWESSTARRDSKTRSDRTGEEPDDSVGE
jgi:hypothetical protein